MSSTSLICFTCPIILVKETRTKYILTSIDLASRYSRRYFARPLRTKNPSEVAFVLEAIYKKGRVFKYPNTFQRDNGSEFKNEVTKLLEKHSVEIRRATIKYKHTHTAFAEAFNKVLAKLLLNRWMLKSFKNLKKYQQSGPKI